MPKRRNISEIACALPRNETLSTKGVEEVFDWRPTFLYAQFRLGHVRGYLIPTKPGMRGKRLWDARSIREFIARHEAPGVLDLPERTPPAQATRGAGRKLMNPPE